MTTKTKIRGLTVAVAATAAVAAAVPLAQAATRPTTAQPAAQKSDGWAGITRQPVEINFGAGWKTKGEFTFPSSAKGRLPVIVLMHGSGPNDMDQTVSPSASTFVPIAQAAAREGYAVLRYNKRGVLGPDKLTDDKGQLSPPKPYERIVKDVAEVVKFAAKSPKVDPSKIYYLGHSEGTNVSAELAARPQRYGVPKPAGVVQMGVVGKSIKELLGLQIYGRLLLQLHEEFDVEADGKLTAEEVRDGLVGQPELFVDSVKSALLKGTKLNRTTDKNRNGTLEIDAEVGPVLRKATGFNKFPNFKGSDPSLVSYINDIGRFPTVTQNLPKFSGPTLLLNGADDIQTPARVALKADAAVGAAGNKDHKIVIYPGMAHTMNVTAKFNPVAAAPDQIVIDEISAWLKAHR